MDEATARKRMVDGQLRPNRVTDARLLAAMASLPRHPFVPPPRRALAHADLDVPLSAARALLKPMVLARLVQALAIRPGERAAVLAAGSGYAAALLAALGAEVVAVEDDPAALALAREAADAVPEAARPLWVVESPAGPLADPALAGPFDAILLDGGAAAAFPPAALGRLAEGGRIAGILGRGEGMAVASLGRKAGGAIPVLPLFDCAAPPLPELAPEPSFAF
ncbi:MAG: protein-L-isoaspartate O-methyltransferase [Acetobacteraceae bacterium]|nr:protein-L-isoaspartate O-methyltransferase [Acetobacteraceae bacterium]MDW8398567.1 protein-L-isoaspartate O-methyltransferase [Acetobacteraceae bacterium]